ncbi:hypothetical protein HMPREF1531_02458 [Propionibacterium sp. oral taxon 192 str. F0372]|uniref:ATP-dependent DNA helicase n=1 Tax=Propionibacterium sp. oral taxon 192 TaxID=671222 RepID=UPI0003546A31|nr:ATP-dependent DNA helicase [Propionibacterium sp. oral taxon 192]EPH00350.1 hypothetical protein HMPREF1531_02458 [Propionibacterium sp. oral taxon 192 str. F0372]
MITTIGELCDLLDIRFSDEQLEAITAPLAPGVIIAGAGTGKTTVMAARVAWLVGTGQVHPAQVLGLTFTRKAAGELANRVFVALTRAGIDTDAQFCVQTYDSFATAMVSEHGLRIGVEPDQRMITGATRFRLGARVLETTERPLDVLSRLQPASIVQRMLNLDSQLGSHLVTPHQVREVDRSFDLTLQEVPLWRGKPTKVVTDARATLVERAELLELVDEYRNLKKRLHLTEFADQMVDAARLAESFPQISVQMRDRYRVVLLDEYQDTSAAQAQLLTDLFSGPGPQQGRGHPVTAVGDPFQAIYGWRGAAPSNILEFPTAFPNSDGSPAIVQSLTINRRSRGLVLDAANQVSVPLLTDPGLSGRVGDRELRSPDGNRDGTIRLASFDTWDEEVNWIADRVLTAHDADGVAWSGIAVLSRTNSPMGKICAALDDREIPYEIVGLGGLLEVEEIAQVVSTLMLLNDVTANPEVVRLLSGRRWKISPRDLAVLGARARDIARSAHCEAKRVDRLDNGVIEQVGQPGTAEAGKKPAEAADMLPTAEDIPCLLEAVADPGRAPLSQAARARIADFAHEMAVLRRHRDEPVTELVSRIMRVSGVRLELLSTPGAHAVSVTRQIDAFINAVAGYVDIDGGGSLSGLVAWLNAERDWAEGLEQPVDASSETVKVMSVHRAKGLEWDVVLLPGLADGVFPATRPPENWTKDPAIIPAELRGDAAWIPQLEGELSSKQLKTEYPQVLAAKAREAEDRLAYVALTRARQELVLTHHHWITGRSTRRNASAYFDALLRAANSTDPHLWCAPDGTVTRTTGQIIVERIAEPSADNPMDALLPTAAWPVVMDETRRTRMQRSLSLLIEGQIDSTDPDINEQVSLWQHLANQLVEDRLTGWETTGIEVPRSLAASAVLLGNRDPAELRNQLVRPMPRLLSNAATVGTLFHAWLEKRFGRSVLLDLDFEEPEEQDPPGPADMALRRLQESFETGPYAEMVPEEIEKPFILSVAGQQIRGRIDAVFATSEETEHDYRVVDWKTSEARSDPLQLSIYRLAWAQAKGIDPARVDAVFHHVRSHRDERPRNLLDVEQLASLLATMRAKVSGVTSVET